MDLLFFFSNTHGGELFYIRMCFISVLGKQFQQERHHGVVVRKLACSVEGRLKSPSIEWETLSFHPQHMCTKLSSELG